MAVAIFVGLVFFELLALAAAVRLFRRRPSPRSFLHAPLVILILFALANEVIIEMLHAWVFPGAPRPFRGLTRALYHLETALVLGWPAGLAAAAWRAFQEPRRASVAGLVIGAVWAVLVLSMAVLHPLDLPGSGAPRTRFLLHAAELVGLVAGAAAVVTSWGRAWSRDAVAVGLLGAVEIAVGLLGPWAHDVFTTWETLARVPYLLGFAALSALLLRWGSRPVP